MAKKFGDKDGYIYAIINDRGIKDRFQEVTSLTKNGVTLVLAYYRSLLRDSSSYNNEPYILMVEKAGLFKKKFLVVRDNFIREDFLNEFKKAGLY